MAVFLIILSGPIQFLILANVGGLNVKPIHICFLYIMAFATRDRRSIEFTALILRQNWAFFLGFSAYLLILLASSFWANDAGAVFSKFVKFSIYFAVCVLSTLVFLRSTHAAVAKAVVFGAIGSISVFLAVTFFALSYFGQNVFSFVFDALRSGNFVAFQFSLYIYLSQYFGSMDPVETAGIRHATVNFLIFMFLLFMAIQPLMRQRGLGQRLAGMVAASMSIVIILLSFSRSSIALIGIVLLFVGAFKLRQRLFRLPARRTAFVLAGSMVAFALGLVVLFGNPTLQGSLEKLSTVLVERFAKLGNDERLQIYGLALQKLDLSPLLGYGGGARVATSDNHFQIHNVFLNAWFETGVLGLCSSIVFMGALLGSWIVSTIRFMRKPDAWVLPYSAAWVMALPILPLVNALQGGDGNFDLASFFCISAFYGWLTANEYQRRRAPLTAQGRMIQNPRSLPSETPASDPMPGAS